MKTVFYKIECLTNLHVGSGEINYNVVDNEVEKDAVSGLPVIHASGIKGALKDALSASAKYQSADIKRLFGAEGRGDTSYAGSLKFLDATLISRPLRVSGSDALSCVSVVTVDSVNSFLRKLSAFRAPIGPDQITAPNFGTHSFLTSSQENIQVECESTGKLEGQTLAQLKQLEGIAFSAPFAVARSFDDYDLPVMARNCLVEGRENLWYEEYVPHGSILYFAVIYPDGEPELEFPEVVQFGGNASIGCGFTKVTKITEAVG